MKTPGCRYAISSFPNVGRVKILAYVGDDTFEVLDSKDVVRRIRRKFLTFLKN